MVISGLIEACKLTLCNRASGYHQKHVNTLRPRQNGRHFADDIFECICSNGNVWIPIKISMKFVPKGPINNIPALVQIMDWCRPGDKPLSEPMMVSLTTHICVTRPQWVHYNLPTNAQLPVYQKQYLFWILVKYFQWFHVDFTHNTGKRQTSWKTYTGAIIITL